MPSENWGWAHVRILGEIAKGSGSKRWKCNFCNLPYNGSYSRVRAHLLGWEGQGVKICTAIDESSRKNFEILDAEGLSHKKKRKCEDEKSGERKTTSQPNIRGVPKTVSKEEVDSSIARFFVSEYFDLDLIKSPHFHDFCNAISAFGSGFEFPSFDEFHSILSREIARVKKRVKDLAKNSWARTGCTIYLVLLLSRFCILVVSRSGTFFLKHFDSHSVKEATSALADAIMEVGQKNVVQITWDSDPMTSEIVDSLAKTGMSVSPTTSLSIRDLLEQIAKEPWINPNITPAAGHPSLHMINRAASFPMYPPLLNLIRSLENSRDPCFRELAPSFCLVSTLLELREKLKEIVNSQKWEEWTISVAAIIKITEIWNFKQYILDEEIWAQAQIMLQISEPFVMSLVGLKTDKILIGDVYNWRIQSLKAVRSTGLDKTIMDRLEMLIEQIWNDRFSKLHALGYMLNPKYFSENQLKGEFVMQDWELILETYKLDESPKRILLEQLHLYSQHHGLMGEEDAIHSRNKLDPVTWWENFGIEIPELKALAIKIFSQISDVFDLLGERYASKVLDDTDLEYVGANLKLEEFSTSRRSIHNVQRIPSKEEVVSPIAKYFWAEPLPRFLIRSPYFQDMVKAIAAFGSGFEYPSIDGLFDLLLSKDKIRIQRGLMASIGDSLSHTGYTIHSFLCNGYYKIFLSSTKGSLCLKVGVYKSDEWSELEDVVPAALNDAILKVGPKNVLQVFCEGDDRLISSVEHRLSKFPHLFISSHADSSIEEFQDHSQGMIISSYAYIFELKNYGDGPLEQFFSPDSFVELEDIFRLKEKFVKMVTSQEWKDWKLTVMKDNMKIVSIEEDILDDNWWADLELILDFYYGYSEFPCPDSIAIMGDCYSWRVQSFEPMIRRRGIDEVTLNKEWDKLFSPLESTGYMLNPKNVVKSPSNIYGVMQGWNSTLKSYEPDKDAKVELRKQLSYYLRQEGRMGEKDAIDGRDEMEPVAWWERFGVEVPDLQRLAIRILSQISYLGVLNEIGRGEDWFGWRSEDLMFLQNNYRLQSQGVGILSFLSGLR